jgi:hypothetical protein
MSQTLVLPDDVYRKLTQSAARRGLTVEAWLQAVTDAAQAPPAVENDRRRGRAIERLLAKCRAGSVTKNERTKLDQLIDEEYRIAVERADARIAAKHGGGTQTTRKPAGRTASSGGRAGRARE